MGFEFEMDSPQSERRAEQPERRRPSFYDTSMSRSGGLDLIPGKWPSPEWTGYTDEVLARTPSFPGEMPEEQIRAVLWTSAIQNAFESGVYANEIPGFRMASYGFLDPETEENAFGVIAYVAPSLHGPIRGEFQWMTVDGESFPVVVRPAEWKLHAPSIHPSLGTSTCWGESRRPSLKGKPAIVTAKHVVGSTTPVGSSVSMTSGSGTLLDLAPEGIDAALVRVSKSHWPVSRNPLMCPQFVAQWTDVDVHSPAGLFSTKVTEVSSGRGTLDSSVPLRIFLANAGQGGDSGALVVDSNGNGIGLYTGEVTTPANLQEGFCQHLGQVEKTMAVDLFL